MPQTRLFCAPTLVLSVASSFAARCVRLGVVVVALVAAALVAAPAALNAQTASAGGVLKATGAGQPFGVAVGADGRIYVLNRSSQIVNVGTIVNGVYTITGALGFTFSSASGLAVDTSNNVYVADYGGGAVYKFTAGTGGTYVKSTLATGPSPFGVAVDAAGNVYYDLDAGPGALYKLVPSGSTYAPPVKISTAQFNLPFDVSVAANGVVYLADPNSNIIYKEVPNGSTYTESALTFTGSPALSFPESAVADANGNLYITNVNGSVLQKAVPTGATSYALQTITNIAGEGQVTVTSAGVVYAVDSQYVIRYAPPSVAAPTTPVATAAAQTPVYFTIGTAGTLPALGNANILTQGASGLDFTLGTGSTCTGALTAGTLCTVNVAFTPQAPGLRRGAVNLYNAAGTAIIATGYISGTGTAPQVAFYPGTLTNPISGLSDAFGIAADASGNLYVTTVAVDTLLKYTPSGAAYTLQTTITLPAAAYQVAVDGAGNIFVTSPNTLYKETLNSSTGTYTQSTITTNSLPAFTGVTVDGSGNIYLAAGINLFVLTPNGSGGYTQTTVANGLNNAFNLTVDASGNLFVNDTGAGALYKYTNSGGTYTKSTVVSGLSNNNGVAVDAGGIVYVVADGTTSGVLRYVPNGTTYTAQAAVDAGTIPRTNGIAIDGSGNLYISSDSTAPIGIYKVNVSSATLNFPNTTVGNTSASQTVTVQNIGNTALTVPIPGSGQNPSLSRYFTQSGSSTCPLVYSTSGSAGTLAAGATCTEILSFAPTIAGAVSGGLIFTDNNLNVAGSTQSIKATGATATALTVSAVSQNAIVATASVTLQFTVGYGGNVAPTAAPTLTVAGSATGVGTITCTAKAGHNVCFAPYNTSALPRGTYTILATQPADGTYAAASGTAILTITNAAGQSSVSPVQTLSVKAPVVVQAQPVVQRSGVAAVLMSAPAGLSAMTAEDATDATDDAAPGVKRMSKP